MEFLVRRKMFAKKPISGKYSIWDWNFSHMSKYTCCPGYNPILERFFDKFIFQI